MRVAAWNGVGNTYGLTQYSTPAIAVPATEPESPTEVKVVAASGTQLNVSWAPAVDPCAGVASYRVQLKLYSPAPSTEPYSPQPLHSLRRHSHRAPCPGGRWWHRARAAHALRWLRWCRASLECRATLDTGFAHTVA